MFHLLDGGVAYHWKIVILILWNGFDTNIMKWVWVIDCERIAKPLWKIQKKASVLVSNWKSAI